MAQPKKIAVYNDNQTQADFLQSAAMEAGHHIYLFDEETAFYNHFISIKPDLMIFRSESLNTVSRLLDTVLFLNYRRSILIFSDNMLIDDLISSSQNRSVKRCPPPYRHAEIKTIIDTAIHPAHPVPDNGSPIPIIVGNTPEIIRIKKMISGLGKNDDAILIQGERGTGRELLAKSIHFASDRNEDAFIVIDIADHISKTSHNRYDWMNNQILTDRSRSFLANGGGTIYFKAIDLLPLSFQGSFLQFFHDDRIGKTRIIADSEIKIDQLVQKGLFRKDLYYRLNVIKIDMPPLRERKADISSLIDFFVTRYCIESNVSHFHLSDKVKKAFSVYDWPQNVEELERIIDRKELLTDEDRLINELDKIIRNNKKKTDKGIQLKKITQYVVSRIESEILKLVLEKTNWNRRRAANTLTISYKSLLNKIKAYNLN